MFSTTKESFSVQFPVQSAPQDICLNPEPLGRSQRVKPNNKRRNTEEVRSQNVPPIRSIGRRGSTVVILVIIITGDSLGCRIEKEWNPSQVRHAHEIAKRMAQNGSHNVSRAEEDP